MVVIKFGKNYYNTDGLRLADKIPAKSFILNLNMSDDDSKEGEYNIGDYILPGLYEFTCQDGIILFRLEDGVYTARMVDENEKNLISIALGESAEGFSQKDFRRVEQKIRDMEKARARKEIMRNTRFMNKMTIVMLIYAMLIFSISHVVKAEGRHLDKKAKGYVAEFYRDLNMLIKTRAGTIIKHLNKDIVERTREAIGLSIISDLASYRYDVKDGVLKVTMKQAQVDLKPILDQYWKTEVSSDGQFITIYP